MPYKLAAGSVAHEGENQCHSPLVSSSAAALSPPVQRW